MFTQEGDSSPNLKRYCIVYSAMSQAFPVPLTRPIQSMGLIYLPTFA